MNAPRPFAPAIERLRAAGLRPTRQRLALARLLFSGPDRHVTAEVLHKEALAARTRVSLATVYNTLRQFTEAGLLREVVVDSQRAYFDTNTGPHHHFYCRDTHELIDIDGVAVGAVPAPPPGTEIEGVEVVVRVRRRAPAGAGKAAGEGTGETAGEA